MSDVEIIDHGWNRIRGELLKLGSMDIRVGVQDAGKAAGGMSMANLAALHEFGSREWQITPKQAYYMARVLFGIDPDAEPDRFWGTVRTLKKRTLRIPERSFLRATVDADAAVMDVAKERVLDAVIAGKMTADEAADQYGFFVVGRIKKRIAGGIDPPNAALTVALKSRGTGSATPLVNTGQLINSITHKVRLQSSGTSKKAPT